MTKWQPIETAPNDCTDILFGKWVDDLKGYKPRWYWQASGHIDGDKIWIDYLDDYTTNQFFHEITHWAPIEPLESIDD